MSLHISFDTNQTTPDELNALAALIAVLGGRVVDPVIEDRAAMKRANPELWGTSRPAEPVAATDLGNDPVPASTTGTTASPSQEPPSDSTAPTSDAPSHDSAGVPWDARIHSTPGKLTEAGVWRKRRGVDDALHASVTAELLAAVEAQGGYTQRMTDEFTAEQADIADAVASAEQAFGTVPPPPPAALGNVPPPPPPAEPVATASPEPVVTPAASADPAEFGRLTQKMGGYEGLTYDLLNQTVESKTLGTFKQWQEMTPAKQPEGTDMAAHIALCTQVAAAVIAKLGGAG